MTIIRYKSELPDKMKYFRLFETTGWNQEYQVDPDQLLSTLQSSWYFVCAYAEYNLVGTGRMLSDQILHAVIFDLIIHPDWQGKGIGTSIMTMLLQKCRADDIRDIQLFSARDKMSFYEKFGFRKRPDNASGMEIKKSEGKSV